MKNNKLIFFISILILVLYFIYGLFFLNVPVVKPDDFWEISRSHFLLKYHHQGDPMFPNEISPFMTSLFNATWGNKYLGIIKTGSQAFFIALVPIDDILAFRLAPFAYSIFVCLLTYRVAIKIGLNKKSAWFSTILLIVVPEFFCQVHSQRPELMITAFYLAGILFFIYIIELKNSWKKTILLFFSGIYSGLAIITLHPNAIVIPATFGCIYLLREHKNIFSLNTFVFAISVLAGCLYFNYLMQASGIKSLSEGGVNFLDLSGPPILRRGFKAVLSLPLVFYHKFSPVNIFARPFSLLFFLGGCVSFYYLLKKQKKLSTYHYLDILCISIAVPIIVLPLISGSNGHYNIFVLPLCAVLISAAVYEFSLHLAEKSKLGHIFAGVLCIIFLSDFTGIKKQIAFAKEFEHIRYELRNTITDSTATIIGNAFYYLDFKNQPYYSNSGMNLAIGRPSQSFEDAVNSVHTNYLIVDDALVYNLYRGRGKNWTDSMFVYLDKNCELVREINANYWLGNYIPPEKYPAQWRYEGQTKNYIKKIKIYKVQPNEFPLKIRN